MAQASPELGAIKQRQQQSWASGDFAEIATSQTIVGEILCESIDLHAGKHVLDVACGSGNTALSAARRFCTVTGVDYVPALLERGRERAAAERLHIAFLEGDAEALPVPDASFDVVLSTFGVMFAPDQPRAADELLRVCRPGGTIGLANWTPESGIAEMFRITSQYAPKLPGLAPPVRWGTEEGVHALLGDEISDVSFARRVYVMRHRSPEHWVAHFRANLGPMHRTFAALDAEGQAAFGADLLAFARRRNRATDDSLAFDSDYLEVVATRR